MDRLIATLNTAGAIAPQLLSIVGLFAPGVALPASAVAQAIGALNAASALVPALAGVVPFAEKALNGQQLNDADIAALAAAADLVDAACEAQVARITAV